jgi:hypothetical protein
VPGAPVPLSFAVLGDSGSGEKPQFDLAARMALLALEFVLHVGDLVYPDVDCVDLDAVVSTLGMTQDGYDIDGDGRTTLRDVEIIATYLGERCKSRTARHGSIQAVAGGAPGSATITWNTGSGQHGQVFLSRNEGSEEFIAEGTHGIAESPVLDRHTLYEFRLYEGREHVRLLAGTLAGLEEER